MTSLPELRSRVAGLMSPSREVDALVYRAFTPELADTKTSPGGWLVGGDHEEPTLTPLLTSSIDAALALVERVLPGWNYHIGKWSKSVLEPAGFSVILGTNTVSSVGKAPTAPLAILLALLDALTTENEHE